MLRITRTLICRSGYGQWTKSLTETDSRTKFITPAFVGEVDQLMVVVDKQEAQLVASRVTAENLMDATVAELVEFKNAFERTWLYG